jgi:hypothetical protein
VCTFDGKIGIVAAARRTLVRQPAGTIKTKPVNVTSQRYREFMVEKVLPAIKLKWPNPDREIVIQQDGASSHINRDDATQTFLIFLFSGLSNRLSGIMVLPMRLMA